jgi:uroporphyrinogen decarboxylase
MDHKERFHATIERRPVDHPATWLGIPVAGALPGLYRHFGVRSVPELIARLDDDVAPVELPYHSPTSNAIYMAFDFAKKGALSESERTLTAPGFFEDYHDPADVALFPWPDPEQYIDPDECRRVVESAPQDRAVLGVLWSAHFQDACSAFGMEAALMKMYDCPDLVHAVTDRIVDFYLRANAIFYEATRGKLDAVLIGNDFGAQCALILAPRMIRQFALPGTRKLVDQAHAYGLKVIHHSCGAIRDIVPDLIDIGVDAIHPIQALAAGMEPRALHADFGDRMSFCGGVDHQNLLVRGTADEVRTRVRELRAIFPTGLIISPSHEAILPDIAPANVEAMFQAARE